jgi:hypothetical protein
MYNGDYHWSGWHMAPSELLSTLVFFGGGGVGGTVGRWEHILNRRINLFSRVTKQFESCVSLSETGPKSLWRGASECGGDWGWSSFDAQNGIPLPGTEMCLPIGGPLLLGLHATWACVYASDSFRSEWTWLALVGAAIHIVQYITRATRTTIGQSSQMFQDSPSRCRVRSSSCPARCRPSRCFCLRSVRASWAWFGRAGSHAHGPSFKDFCRQPPPARRASALGARTSSLHSKF